MVELNFPACLAEDFPTQLPRAISAVDRIITSIEGADFSPLARNSPGLDTSSWDWRTYLRCSIARMVHVLAALEERGVTSGRVLDFGSYFGTFSLFLAEAGFTVDALDAYRRYAPALDGPVRLLGGAGVSLLDFDDVGRELERIAADQYDVVLCMGVIEHIPHTPRYLLTAFDRVLKPGGQLVMDTPNQAHIYNRQKLARGESIYAALPTQFLSERPFEGHHREYTLPEMVWMVEQIGHTDVRCETYNYSVYEQQKLVGRDEANHWAAVRDPLMRELLLTVSTKSGRPAAAGRESGDWRRGFVDKETVWQRRLPSGAGTTTVSPESEQMLVELQQEIEKRDALIRDVNTRAVEDVSKRDGMLAALEAGSQAEIQRRDAIIDRLRREWPLWRKLWARLGGPQS